MARSPRHKNADSTFYHLVNRVAGSPRFFPFKKRYVARKFVSLFEFYLNLYFCRLAAFQLMGNHYHAVVHFERFRELHRQELEKLARLRFGRRWLLRTRSWSKSNWRQFNRDLFDVSKMMQHINGEFSKWFNQRHGRRGHFWADRFKNPELLDLKAIQLAILYCELNAVRAGLVSRPEDHRIGSAYWRWAGKKADILIPLEELFPPQPRLSAFATYRQLLYHHGGIDSSKALGKTESPVRRVKSTSLLQQPGLLLRRLRFLSDGLAIGQANGISALLEQFRRKGRYKRRRNPIPQLQGCFFSLREQRSRALTVG